MSAISDPISSNFWRLAGCLSGTSTPFYAGRSQPLTLHSTLGSRSARSHAARQHLSKLLLMRAAAKLSPRWQRCDRRRPSPPSGWHGFPCDNCPALTEIGPAIPGTIDSGSSRPIPRGTSGHARNAGRWSPGTRQRILLTMIHNRTTGLLTGPLYLLCMDRRREED
jgi:hypothetical protein